MGVRRVVTGHDANGKAIFTGDSEVEPTRLVRVPGAEFCPLWGADHPLRFPGDGSKPASPGYFPPLGGFRFGMFTLAPDSVAFPDGFDMEAAMGELEEKLPGLADFLEPDNPGMHTSATVDYEYIVSGRCVLELDDGGPGSGIPRADGRRFPGRPDPRR